MGIGHQLPVDHREASRLGKIVNHPVLQILGEFRRRRLILDIVVDAHGAERHAKPVKLLRCRVPRHSHRQLNDDEPGAGILAAGKDVISLDDAARGGADLFHEGRRHQKGGVGIGCDLGGQLRQRCLGRDSHAIDHGNGLTHSVKNSVTLCYAKPLRLHRYDLDTTGLRGM